VADGLLRTSGLGGSRLEVALAPAVLRPVARGRGLVRRALELVGAAGAADGAQFDVERRMGHVAPDVDIPLQVLVEELAQLEAERVLDCRATSGLLERRVLAAVARHDVEAEGGRVLAPRMVPLWVDDDFAALEASLVDFVDGRGHQLVETPDYRLGEVVLRLVRALRAWPVRQPVRFYPCNDKRH